MVLALLVLLFGCRDDGVGAPSPDPPDFTPEPDPVAVIIRPDADTLHAVGATAAFQAVAVGPDDQLLTGVTILWSSSNTNVATIGETSGTATAVGPGVTSIRASAGPASATAALVVEFP